MLPLAATARLQSQARSRKWPLSLSWLAVLAVGAALCSAPASRAADHAAAPDHGAPEAKKPASAKAASSAPTAAAASGTTTIATEPLVDLKKSIKANLIDKKNMTVMISEKPDAKAPAAKPTEHGSPSTAHPVAVVAPSRPKAPSHSAPTPPKSSRAELQAKAAAMAAHGVDSAGAAHGGEVHWSYEGEGGPQNWGKLKPEFSACATGKRQTPINIEDAGTLHGPAEPLQFNYTPSAGSVVNNGHTVQVDVQGDNTMTVRGTTYRLLQFHFHTPSEEQINDRAAAMVAHLVHKSADGQLAVVAVLLDPGQPNPVINTVWTYMPLDTNDRVRLPAESIDLNELLPKDQRYYQFIGSLTTPPCTEGVLWNVLKQPAQISREQWRLFQQLFPNNARPVQPINGRPIRNAQ